MTNGNGFWAGRGSAVWLAALLLCASVGLTAHLAARAESLGGEPMRFWAVGFDGRAFSAP